MTFKVKEESVFTFFGVAQSEDNFRNREISPYYLMKDEIFLTKRPELPVDTQVIFELEDTSIGSRSKLVNTYTYFVHEYDDVSVKLTLENFKVEQKNLS